MAYDQVKACNIKNMGKAKGWCLQNTRVAFGIMTGTYPSAKADMEAQKKAGTLHDIASLPKNVCVPVYIDTSSQYEHVGISYYGDLYEDGSKISWSKYKTYFGWGETCDGVRVVKYTAQTKFLPSKGYWCLGDRDERIDILSQFMYAVFPAYTNRKALGNFYGEYIKKSITEFQKRTGLYPDGCVGPKTYAKLEEYGFSYKG